MLTRDSTELTDPGVVPSLAHRWSHHTGGTHLKVVPCHWRATACSSAPANQPGRTGLPHPSSEPHVPTLTRRAPIPRDPTSHHPTLHREEPDNVRCVAVGISPSSGRWL